VVAAGPSPPTPEAQWTLPKLRITRDGEWFDAEVEITHPGVLRNLRGMLRRDAEGYFVQTRFRIPVEVDDVPLVLVRLERRGDRLHGTLSDGSEVEVDPASLRIGRDNVPYCAVGEFEARLSRAAAFQLLAMIEADGAAGREVLRIGGREHLIPRTS
jgi:hypothetical protein